MENESRMAQTLAEAKKRVAEAAIHARDVTTEKAREVAKSVDESVRKNPWPYIGGAVVAGLVIGYLVGRRRDR